MNKVVARYTDGRVIRGTTTDFLPAKAVFHLAEREARPGSEPLTVKVAELKALFFVKDFVGDPEYVESVDFDPARPPVGRRIRVVFDDGETLVGTTQGYQPDRSGFFIEPADPDSNNERCYVVAAATKEVGFI